MKSITDGIRADYPSSKLAYLHSKLSTYFTVDFCINKTDIYVGKPKDGAGAD